MEEQDIPTQTDQPPKKKPAFDPNKSFQPVQEKGKPSFDEDKPFQEVKKKDGAGSVSPLGSSQNQDQTGQPVSTSDSEVSSKQFQNNYKNNSLTPKDIHSLTKGPDDTKDWSGLTAENIAFAINNKGINLYKASNAPMSVNVSKYIKEQKDVQKKIEELSMRQSMVGDVPDYESQMNDLKGQEQYFRSGIQRSYDAQKKKIVPELLDNLKKKVDVADWTEAYGKPAKEGALGIKIESPLQWIPENHKLTPKSVEWVAKNVDDAMNRRGDDVVNAQVSGDLDKKERTYYDLTKSVVDYLNTIPIKKEQDEFKKEYTEKNPQLKDAIDANSKVNEYFSKDRVDDIKAKVNVNRDKEFLKTQQKYFGKNGIFNQNKYFIGIQEKYAQLVADGKMSEDVAKKQIQAEIKEHPGLRKTYDNMQDEVRKINGNTQKEFQNYIVSGLQKDHPKLTVYKDGSVGVADLSEDQYKNMMEGYEEGLDKVAKKIGGEQVAATMKEANEKAKRVGAFWGSVGSSANELTSAFSKFIFNKTQWGGDKVRNFEAKEIASPQIGESEIAASWNWKGIESLKDPNFWMSKVGSMVPVIAGASAVGLATDGAGMPQYVGWLANAGLFTAQSGLSTYNQLLNTRDAQGNLLTEADAAHHMANQMEKDFLPNLLMMAVTSGTLLKAKNIAKPSLLGTAAKGLAGAAIAQPFFTWQGYNDYATMQEAQGKPTDFWDYMQSKDFKDNLINGMVVGGGLSLLHAPGTYMKSVDNWTKMVHTSDGEFKNLIPQNYALAQEMAGNGNYLRDALKLHVFNIDPEGLNVEGKRNLADLKNTLLYSVNLDKNIRVGNLDPTNIKDLYQAHNLSLADQHDYLSEQAAKEGNKSLSDIYKDKAKDYREQAKAASNGEAKYHYLVNDEWHPIFMSDKSFKTLEQEGTIGKWMKDGTVESVHKSDDPEFAKRYKDFVTAKDESIVEGKGIVDHATGLIEENKDKLGVYYGMAKENPELFYKEVSDQVFGRNADGTVSLHPDAEIEARTQYGDDIVDMAKVMYPETTEQKIEKSGTVNPVLSRINNAEYINEKELDKAADELYSILDDTEKNKKMTPEQKASVANLIEPLISKIEQYDFRTNTETSTITEKVPTQIARETAKREIRPALEQSVGSDASVSLPGGGERKGKLAIKDGNYVIDVPGEEPVVIGEKAISDRDLKLPSEEKMADPIQFDAYGNVKSVTFETKDGKLITINDPEKALDLAIQLRAEAVGEVSPEQFDTVYEEIQKEVSKEVPVKDIFSPIKSEGNETEKTKEAEGLREVKKEEDGGVKKPLSPPKLSVPPVRKPAESPKDEFTAVRKEKNAEIKGAKELFERQKVIKWTETYDKALANVQAMFPDKNLYDAMKGRIGHFTAMLDNGTLFNPTSEDISVFNVFKDETKRRINEIQGWDSNDNIQRLAAVAEFTVLQNDLFNVARVTNPGGEAGRAFNLLQSEIAQDPDYGLQIRRMELLGAKGGGKLSQADLDFTAENWGKEQALTQKEKSLKQRGMQEQFDKKLADIRAEYDKKLKEARGEKKPSSEKEKREKLLKEKGADLAARIRKGKDVFKGGTYVTFPGLPQAVNIVLEGIAKLVEGGYSLAQAIDEYVQANKIKNKDQFTNDLFTVFNKQEKQEDAYGKIQKLAQASGVTDVTNDMAGKNLIRDYVDSHVGLHEPKDVLDVAYAELKKILPDLEKDRLVEAYLKQGDFKQSTKKELESGFKQAHKNFDRLVKLEKDINDLNEKENLYKKTNNKPSPYDKEIEEKEKEKKAIMDSMGIKTSSEDKYTKASYDQRAKSHNDRLSDIISSVEDKYISGGLSDKSDKALLKLNGQLEAAKIKIDPTSALSQDKTLDGGLSALKSIKSEFQRTAMDDAAKLGDINRSLQKAIDKFSSDKDESQQDAKLQRAKEQAKRDSEKYFQKISKGEYEDNPVKVLDKTDAELLRLQRDKGAIEQLYKNKKNEFAKERKDWAKKTGDFLRAAEVAGLIGSPFTLAKVGASALLRPQLEAITKLGYRYTVEQLPWEFTRNITERAKLGGESTSIESIRKGYKAYLQQYGEEGLKKLYATANEKFEKASKAYIDQEAEVNRTKYMGMDKPEYKDAVKKLERLKNEKDAALVDAVGNSIYQFIAGSSLKESLEVFLHRSALLERNFGHFDREGWDSRGGEKLINGRSLSDIDNWNYIVNGIGRSHAALKNYSARFSFATGFMARLEYYAKEGIDISQPDKLLEIAHESYGDWERGKYQESNWFSDKWNQLTADVERRNPEMAYLMRADVAITRVPVNMLYEGIMEYTLGGLTGSWIAGKEYLKARKITLQSNFGPEEQAQFKQELSEQLKKMDPKSAAAIVRAYRKQGFGVGMYALFLLGHAAFGGYAHKGQTAEDKKKAIRELETGIPEIKTGEIKIGDWKMPEAAAKIIEHTPAFQMPLFALGLSQVYENSVVDGRSTPQAVKDAALGHINHIVNSIPMLEKVAIPLAAGAVGGIKDKYFSGKWDDVDQDGNPMKRKAFNMYDYLNYLPGYGNRKDILSETYYKQAVSAQKSYRNQITDIETNTGLSKKDKEEQRQALLKELNETIDSIYEQNKENPQ